MSGFRFQPIAACAGRTDMSAACLAERAVRVGPVALVVALILADLGFGLFVARSLSDPLLGVFAAIFAFVPISPLLGQSRHDQGRRGSGRFS